ncbi:hypothetical protein B0I35DRAFT_483193 [Stachybotrys elegans]|uniref:Fucose-specific lectin n=1 Tax=Stachybotrys elegans TaxID=80388 RepID=A0A8K0SL52_9HYPO|nr:hypothetical protein B0I35DRAFT_483193 [Stachybotrys elegans]
MARDTEYSSLPIPVDADPVSSMPNGMQVAYTSEPPQTAYSDGKETAYSDGKEVAHGQMILPPYYKADNDAAGMFAPDTPAKRPWYRKRNLAIGAGVLLLIVVAGVVGGVVGVQQARNNDNGDVDGSVRGEGANGGGAPTESDAPSGTEVLPSSTVSSAPSATSTTTSASQMPTSIANNSALAAVAWDLEGEYNMFLAYQDSEGALMYSHAKGDDASGRTNWAAPEEVQSEYQPREVSSLGMAMLPQISRNSNDRTPQLEWFFVNGSSHLNGVNMNMADESRGFSEDSITELMLGVQRSSKIASYWPYVLLQGLDNQLNLIYYNGGWQIAPTGVGAQPRSHFAIVPLSRNFTLSRNDGAWALLYQGDNGRLLPSVSPTGRDAVWDPLKEMWESTFPPITIADEGPFAAFSVATPGAANVDNVDTYVLYQEEDSSDIKQLWFSPNNGEWRTSSPGNLRGADEGTQIACITAPTWTNERTVGTRLLGETSDLTRCFFFKEGRVVESRFNGRDWSRPVRVEMP